MTRMLETLDARVGHDMSEIGTGTGYNAALPTHRIGHDHIFSIDTDPELVELARERLARIGYRPTLVVTDSVNGLPEHAPYDRYLLGARHTDVFLTSPDGSWCEVSSYTDNGTRQVWQAGPTLVACRGSRRPTMARTRPARVGPLRPHRHHQAAMELARLPAQ